MIQWDITLSAFGSGRATRIVKDGEDITNQIDDITIHASVNAATRVTVTYLPSDVRLDTEVGA